MFGALQYVINRQLFVKAVVAYAKSHFFPTFSSVNYDDTMWSGRIRLTYLF